MKTADTASKSAPRGRPKSTKAKAVRISPRFPAHLADRIQRAADWRGVSVAAFIVEAAMQRAEEVIEKEERWSLTEEEARNISEMIANPPKPTAYAMESARLAAEHVKIRY